MSNKGSQSRRGDSNGFIDIRTIFRNYLHYWWWFVVSVAVCVGLVFAYTKIRKPVYQVTSNILISSESGELSIARQMGGAVSSLLGAKSSVDDELMIMRSHSLLCEVADELGLTRVHVLRYGPLNLQRRFCYLDFPIEVEPMTAGMIDTLRTEIFFRIYVDKNGKIDYTVKAKGDVVAKENGVSLPAQINTPYGGFKVVTTKDFLPGEAFRTDVTVSGTHPRAESLAEDLKIESASKKTNMVTISFKHPDIEYASDLLNTLMSAYNRKGLEIKHAKARKSLGFIDNRIAAVAADINDNADSLQDYLVANGLTNIEADVKFQMEMKGVLEEGLIKAETEAAVTKMLRDFLRDPSNEFALMPATTTDLASATEAYNELILKRMGMEQNAKGDNVALRSLNEQITAMRQSILESLDKVHESARITLNEVKSRHATTSASLNRLPEQQREVLTMMRDQLVKEKILAFLVSQREETAMQIENAIPKGTIIDEAYAGTEPVGPTRLILLFIAFIIGLAIPPTILYLRKLSKGMIETVRDASDNSDLPYAGDVAYSETDVNLATDWSRTATKEDMRNLRMSVTTLLSQADGKNLLVTSAAPATGATWIAVRAAQSLAALGKRVAVVDMDLRNGSLARDCGVKTSVGVTDYLSDSSLAVKDLLVADPSNKGLWIIGSGKSVDNQPELLASSRLGDLFGQLDEQFDYVVVDAGQLGMVSDVVLVAPYCQATLFIVKVGVSSTREIKTANEMYKAGALPSMALVVNNA